MGRGGHWTASGDRHDTQACCAFRRVGNGETVHEGDMNHVRRRLCMLLWAGAYSVVFASSVIFLHFYTLKKI